MFFVSIMCGGTGWAEWVDAFSQFQQGAPFIPSETPYLVESPVNLWILGVFLESWSKCILDVFLDEAANWRKWPVILADLERPLIFPHCSLRGVLRHSCKCFISPSYKEYLSPPLFAIIRTAQVPMRRYSSLKSLIVECMFERKKASFKQHLAFS